MRAVRRAVERTTSRAVERAVGVRPPRGLWCRCSWWWWGCCYRCCAYYCPCPPPLLLLLPFHFFGVGLVQGTQSGLVVVVVVLVQPSRC